MERQHKYMLIIDMLNAGMGAPVAGQAKSKHKSQH